jgi:hypothetical protein
MVNLCNHGDVNNGDVNRELCSIHLFLVMALSFSER